MIDFTLTEDQKMLRQLAHAYAAKEIRPIALEMDHEPDEKKSFALSSEAVQKGMKLGFGKLQVPTKYGGYGGGFLDYVIAMEEIAWGDVGITSCLSVTGGAALDLSIHGNEAQKEQWLRPYCEDTTGTFLFCGSMTEPEGGSEMLCPLPDPSLGMKGSAVLDGDEYVLNCSRVFCTNAKAAKVILIAFRTDKTKPNWESISDFIVSMDTPGIQVGRRFDLTGWRGSPQSEIFFDNVRVPKECYVGPANLPWHAYLTAGIRIGIRAVGIGRAAYEEAISYASERKSWGKPIREHQLVAGKLVDMRMKIEASRALVWKMAWALDHREESDGFYKLLPMCKIFPSSLLQSITSDAMQIMGTYGCTKECAVEKYARDAAVLPIVDGGDTIHKIFLAERL